MNLGPVLVIDVIALLNSLAEPEIKIIFIRNETFK